MFRLKKNIQLLKCKISYTLFPNFSQYVRKLFTFLRSKKVSLNILYRNQFHYNLFSSEFFYYRTSTKGMNIKKRCDVSCKSNYEKVKDFENVNEEKQHFEKICTFFVAKRVPKSVQKTNSGKTVQIVRTWRLKC